MHISRRAVITMVIILSGLGAVILMVGAAAVWAWYAPVIDLGFVQPTERSAPISGWRPRSGSILTPATSKTPEISQTPIPPTETQALTLVEETISATPTPTQSQTPTTEFTGTTTLTPTSTSKSIVYTKTPTYVALKTATYTPKPTNIPTQPKATKTPTPVIYYAPTKTPTPKPPTATFTLVPTFTPTNTWVVVLPTNTGAPTATDTPPATATFTSTPTATYTHTPIPTALPTSTFTPPAPTDTPYVAVGTPTVDFSDCTWATHSSFENELLTLINNARSAQGLRPLRMNSMLRGAAREHSADMACHNFVSHTGSNGTTNLDRILAYGYSPTWWGENIYKGWNTTPQQAFNWWMNSTPHYNNIMSPNYTHIGIGHAAVGVQNAYTLTFGRP